MKNMLLLCYVKKHILLHIAAFVMYGALFFLMLLVIGEIVFENGYDQLSIEDTTYTFRLYTDDKSKVESIISSIDNYSDLLVASEEDRCVFVSFITQISEERNTGSLPSIQVENDEIAYNSPLYFYEAFSDEIDSNNNILSIDNRKFDIVGRQNIQLCLPVELWKVIYLSTDDFWKIKNNNSILLSIFKEERMSDSELKELKLIIANNGVTSVEYLPDRKSLVYQIVNSDEVRIIFIMALITCLCFARLILMLVENRIEEYRIMRYCGATKFKIAQHIFKHVFFVLIVSAILGIALYWTVRLFAPNLIAYSSFGPVFYLLVLAGYLFASLSTSGIFILAKAAKDGY